MGESKEIFKMEVLESIEGCKIEPSQSTILEMVRQGFEVLKSCRDTLGVEQANDDDSEEV